jgi:hypothetical protein
LERIISLLGGELKNSSLPVVESFDFFTAPLLISNLSA